MTGVGRMIGYCCPPRMAATAPDDQALGGSLPPGADMSLTSATPWLFGKGGVGLNADRGSEPKDTRYTEQ